MKKKVFQFTLSIGFFFTALFLAINDAGAVPAFARQTGMACNSCHFQHFPSLNEFGRSFKAGGYTTVGGQSLIEGDLLSLPSVLNASIVTKIRYQKTNGDSKLVDKKNSGELQFPDEGALLFGGRVGEHVGFLLETQLVDDGEVGWASFKIPFVYDVSEIKLSIVPFTTDAGGAAYGFDLLNTGAMRMQRPLEHRSETSAQQYIGTATAATGFSFVASNPIGYINYTAWSPEHLSTDAAPYLKYYRAVLTPKVGTWDLAIGAQVWDGETKYTDDTVPVRMEIAAEAWAIDAQAQGNVGGMPLGAYLTYGKADKSGGVGNLFNAKADDKKAWTALLELGVMPGKTTVAAAYRHGENGDATDNAQNALTLGATYLLTQNVEFQINHTWYSGSWYDVPANNEGDIGDNITTLMVFAAF
ncbi:MAG: hypothetical protein WA162_03575 [Thermodesulfobacteriota bacterium]